MGDNAFMAGNLTSVPTVVDITPVADATDVSVTSEITLTFITYEADSITSTNLH
jgi:F420-0:gamma-glutamyl ligase-like protein